MTTENKSLNSKLDRILLNQKKILENEKKILGEEVKIEDYNTKELANEGKEIGDEIEVMGELAKLEDEFKVNIISSPMKNITKRDVIKGFIGAFVGVMGHFAFSIAADIATSLSVIQSSILYLVAFVMIVLMLYFTGFRNVETHVVAKFMPLRALVLYTVSIITILFVNLIFGSLNASMSFLQIYNLVGASIILAVMGAGTADLIGTGK